MNRREEEIWARKMTKGIRVGAGIVFGASVIALIYTEDQPTAPQTATPEPISTSSPTAVPAEMIQGNMPRELTQGTLGSITAVSRCSGAHPMYGQIEAVIPPHIDLDIRFGNIDWYPEGIMTTIENLSNRQRAIISYVDGVMPTGFTLHDQIRPIRGQNRTIDYLRPNTEYSIVVYRNDNTFGSPVLDNPVTFTIVKTGNC